MTIYYHKLFILSIHYDKYFHKVIIFYHACVYPCRDGAAEARKDVLCVTFTSGNAAGVRRCADNFTVGAENKLARRSGAQKLFAGGKHAGMRWSKSCPVGHDTARSDASRSRAAVRHLRMGKTTYADSGKCTRSRILWRSDRTSAKQTVKRGIDDIYTVSIYIKIYAARQYHA